MLMSSSVDWLMSSSTSRSGGGCIRERVNCLCLCLACVLRCRYDCLLNVVLDFPCL